MPSGTRKHADKGDDSEADLNNCIKEYLEVKSLHRTVTEFVLECQKYGLKLSDSKGGRTGSPKWANVLREMLRLFSQGAFMEFFQLWDEHLSSKIKEDVTSQKLEFKINVYFAVYPLLQRNSKGTQSPTSMPDQGMANLKYYLETKGSAMSQTPEFLPFFALPYIPNPKTHPSLQDIFKESWAGGLQSTLKEFLSQALDSSCKPRLYEIFQAGTGEEGNKLSQKHTQQQIYDSEKRALLYNRKYQKIQADYQNLIGVAADLIDSLEMSVQGHPVDTEFLQTMCQRLFANQLRQSISASVDLRRPGTAGNMLRQSVAVSKVNESASDYLQMGDLDYDKVKYMITDGDWEERALLLQALRWRLTRATPSERDQVLTAYIRHDLLGCTQPGVHRRGVMALYRCEDGVVRQYTARLFNAFASLSQGRTYLSHNEELLRTLVETLRLEDRDTIARENVLGALQKLSLRRQMQTSMIEEGIIEWLIRLLKENDDLSDYNLEYAVALTMNLCLRNAGKMRCAREPKLVLEVLSDLLGHENLEIRPYVNGALYSILGIPSIRDKARSMGMEDILRCFIKDGQADMNRQIEFIIKQLNSADDTADDLSDDEEDEDDDEDQDAMEADLDKAEVLRPEPGRLQGDILLLKQYTLSTDKRNRMRQLQKSATPFNRPVTPNQMRPMSRALAPSPLLSAVAERPPTGSHSKSGHRPRTGETRPKSGTGSNGGRPVSGQSNRSAHSNSSRMSHHSNSSSRRSSLSHSQSPSPTGQSMKSNGMSERPITRSGSRPSSASGDNNGGNLTPRPRSGSKNKKASTSATPISSYPKSPEYETAFGSKPRIPRTPDTRSMSKGMGLPPQPTYSDSLPSPRPNSGSSEKGRRN
ncbi:lisH domain-containing protein ARMC9-like isoform X2 [Watersipora subatra]|uniref:lisH domain-containing protein ARMC9-like isoform X2 n=1 Tax=Watersipora subatra TaxID=2589382 RepID=UPI00355B0F24